MNCPECQASLIDHYFGELPPAVRPALEVHLQGCPECWGEFLAIKQSVELVGIDPAPPLPPERLRRSLQAQLKKEYGRSLGDLLALRIPAYAVLLAVLLTALFTLAVLRLRSDGAPSVAADPSAAGSTVLSEYYDSTRTGSLEIF